MWNCKEPEKGRMPIRKNHLQLLNTIKDAFLSIYILVCGKATVETTTKLSTFENPSFHFYCLVHRILPLDCENDPQ